jgi:hypothetical protein
MRDYPKQVKKHLRELVGLAYEAELKLALTQLAEQFDAWRENKISSGKLSDLIHEYHQGPSRELFNLYDNAPIDILVASAVARGLLKEEDVPAEVLLHIQNALEFARQNLAEDVE